MITDVAGILVGHWTDEVARTGCTVVLFPEGTVASAEVRGGAPATRELALLAPERTVERLDAAVLTGGSAFGLASADGVVRWCEEQGRGFDTSVAKVPIVAALGLFDLGVGDATVRPTAESGYEAATSAGSGPLGLGLVGAGTGATVGKWRGPEHTRAGGLGSATVRRRDLIVSALVAVNAFGDIDTDGSATDHIDTDHMDTDPTHTGQIDPGIAESAPGFANTTIGVVATNARLDKLGCLVLAQGAHDGLARSIVPAHSRLDGDAFIAAATGEVDADVDTVRLLTVVATERAIRSVAGGASLDH